MSYSAVAIDYTNWRGERRLRTIVPLCIRFGTTEWHKTPCWLMDAHDVEADTVRAFRLADVHSWTEVSP